MIYIQFIFDMPEIAIHPLVDEFAWTILITCWHFREKCGYFGMQHTLYKALRLLADTVT